MSDLVVGAGPSDPTVRERRGLRKAVLSERRVLHSVTRSLSWAHFLPAILVALAAGAILALARGVIGDGRILYGALALSGVWAALGLAIRLRKRWAILLSLPVDALLLLPAIAFWVIRPASGTIWIACQILYVWGGFRALRAFRTLREAGLDADSGLDEMRSRRFGRADEAGSPGDGTPELSIPCPHCSEPVRARARKCRHCGERLAVASR